MSKHQRDIIRELEDYKSHNVFVEQLLEKGFEETTLREGFGTEPIPEWMTLIDNPDLKNYWIYRFFENCQPDVLKLWVKNGFLKNDVFWMEEIWMKWNEEISSVFLLNGNIQDYAFSPRKGYMPANDFVIDEFLNRPNGCKYIIKYSLSLPLELQLPEGSSEEESQSGIKLKLKRHIESQQQSSNGTWDQLMSDFKFIHNLLEENSDLIVMIDNVDMIFANESSNIVQNLLSDYLIRWAYSTNIAHNKNAVILTAESAEGINRHLISQSNKIEIIHVPRPKLEEERLKFILFLHSMSKPIGAINTRTKIKRLPNFTKYNLSKTNRLSLQIGSLAYLTSGLNYIGIEDLILQINATGKNTIETINHMKGNILQTESGGLLELVNSKKDLTNDICGYLEIKKQLMFISEIIKSPNVSKLRKRTIPMGILFVGPPGTGKTVVAEAFSNSCGMNFLKLGDFRSKWVGESERNLSKILELIKSYSPVIVFMDELDQTEGSRGTSGNSDVDKRLFSKLLQFMSDTKNRGNVLWIAASNRPDLIDTALKRPGRFDLKIPFLPQNAEDRYLTFLRYLSNDEYPELKTEISDSNWAEIKSTTKDFTGAEIEEVVNSSIRKKIMNTVNHQEEITISAQDLLDTIHQFQPGISTAPFNHMIEASLADVTSKELIPIEWSEWKNPYSNEN